MEVRIATPSEMAQVSALSMRLGNIPYFVNQATVAILTHQETVVGFAAVQTAQHAAGSWIEEKHRRKGFSYQLRHCLDSELRRQGIPVYFALPQSDFEKQLFAKYGQVTEHLVQVRHL